MQQERIETLTQDQLVAELHKRGCSDITRRRITDWRAHDLLPAFDVTGSGRGRKRGRESSSWSNGPLVLSQAASICELLKLYRKFDDLYLPLWMLGYPISMARVREALSKPLDAAAIALEAEAGLSRELEDQIDDVVYDVSKEVECAQSELFQVPQEALAAFINIFFNRGYDLTDDPFEHGLEMLKEWERTILEKHAVAPAEKEGESANLTQQHESAGPVFDHAPFLMKYLSLHQIKRAVDECTDDDLRAVTHDLWVGRQMVQMIHRMWAILSHNLSAEFKPSAAEVFRSIFIAGRLLIWADLSLRRNGFAAMLDHYLPVALIMFREEFNKEMEGELAATSQDFANIMESCFMLIKNSLSHAECKPLT